MLLDVDQGFPGFHPNGLFPVASMSIVADWRHPVLTAGTYRRSFLDHFWVHPRAIDRVV